MKGLSTRDPVFKQLQRACTRVARRNFAEVDVPSTAEEWRTLLTLLEFPPPSACLFFTSLLDPENIQTNPGLAIRTAALFLGSDVRLWDPSTLKGALSPNARKLHLGTARECWIYDSQEDFVAKRICAAFPQLVCDWLGEVLPIYRSYHCIVDSHSGKHRFMDELRMTSNLFDIVSRHPHAHGKVQPLVPHLPLYWFVPGEVGKVTGYTRPRWQVETGYLISEAISLREAAWQAFEAAVLPATQMGLELLDAVCELATPDTYGDYDPKHRLMGETLKHLLPVIAEYQRVPHLAQAASFHWNHTLSLYQFLTNKGQEELAERVLKQMLPYMMPSLESARTSSTAYSYCKDMMQIVTSAKLRNQFKRRIEIHEENNARLKRESAARSEAQERIFEELGLTR